MVMFSDVGLCDDGCSLMYLWLDYLFEVIRGNFERLFQLITSKRDFTVNPIYETISKIPGKLP